MANCKECLFRQIYKDAFGTTFYCHANLDGEGVVVSKEMLKNPCELFGNLNKVKELWDNKQKYNWKEFGKDKRTAHYKSTKEFQEKGADLYLTIYTWTENSYAWAIGRPSEILQDFYWERALVHYKDGSFYRHAFRRDYTNKKNKKE